MRRRRKRRRYVGTVCLAFGESGAGEKGEEFLECPARGFYIVVRTVRAARSTVVNFSWSA